MKKELATAFLAETHGLLAKIRRGLAEPEPEPGRLAELFRFAHMLKGDVKLADRPDVERLAGPLADSLRAARARGALSREAAALIGQAVEDCELLLDGKPVAGVDGLIARLEGLAAGVGAAAPRKPDFRILLIEDSDLQSSLIRRELAAVSRASFTVESAARLDEGLSRLDGGGFDAVLLDLNLPDSQGVATFAGLASRAPAVPVVILTISDDDAMATQALSLGAQDYMVKSQATGHLLARVIRYAIERKRVDAALRRAREELEERVRDRTAQLSRVNERLRQKSLDLERTNHELSLFASIAAHELQEPVRKIVNYGEMLERQSGECLDEKGREQLATMRDAAARQGELIKSLRELTQISVETKPLEPLELGPVARAVAIEAAPALDQAGGRLELGELPRIKGDPIQLAQLFTNLVANAVKYRQPGRPLLVCIVSRPAEPGWVEISVEDNGIGFEQKYADRIFRPFQRLHGRGEYSGLGMGLAICARIVWRHGGRIEARSEPGRGSVFTITLPSLEAPR